MRLHITVEQFQTNEALKIIQSTIRWKIRVGYRKSDLIPLLVAEYGGGYIARNININSTSSNIREIMDLLDGKYENFKELDADKILFLDTVLSRHQDYLDIQAVLITEYEAEVELDALGVDTNG